MGISEREANEKLRRIQEETKKRKEELEKLQMEELRQIREMEKLKMAREAAGYTDDEDFSDSAFGDSAFEQSTSGHSPEREDAVRRAQEREEAERLATEREEAERRALERQRAKRQAARKAAEEEARKKQEVKKKSIKKVSDVDDISYDDESRYAAEPSRSRRSENPVNREHSGGRDSRGEYAGGYREDDIRGKERKQRNRDAADEDTRPKKKREKKTDDWDRPVKTKRKKKNPVFRFFRNLLIIILILAIIMGVMIHNVVKKFDTLDTAVSKRSDAMTGSIMNILLVGQDAREGQSGQRSDSMIICSVNRVKNKVTLISIMRDTYVEIPGYGSNRINAAFAYGGYDLLDETIEHNFGIKIDGNAEVDFEGFLTAMTAIGDLELDLTKEEAEYLNSNQGLGYADDGASGIEAWNLTEGTNKMNPNQVLAYSRMRYVGHSDWDRTARQRNVISAAMSKVKHGHLIGGYKMANEAAPSIATDLKTSGMMKCVLPMLLSGDADSYLIPAEGAYSAQNVNGMAVLVPDIEKNRELIQQYINGTYEETEE